MKAYLCMRGNLCITNLFNINNLCFLKSIAHRKPAIEGPEQWVAY